ncbi:putative phosphoribosyl transferase domain protein [Diaporthe ampelina]|uniref:Putative phosphoribosyl transferase domain protein n=1 Tax=Diaporthe ampelina TaxID=1214573 RepID=A0A0G2HXJ0_9PEZI|nr:putative phosphoribosyl transferase domain protein [Diaporthe ampelina]
MATVDSLKRALRQTAEEATLIIPRQPFSDAQYSAGLDILTHGAGWLNYEDFIIPQTSQLLGPLFDSRTHVSVLEIGPGRRSLLSYLPRHLRHKVRKYKAFEPNSLFAARLEESLAGDPGSERGPTLPCLESPPDICRKPFDANDNKGSGTRTNISSRDNGDKYDVILVCHSMYGMKPKRAFIGRMLGMLADDCMWPHVGGLLVVFHRDNGALHLEDLVCHRTASFCAGVVEVADNDGQLDSFASFVAGFTADDAIRAEWRKICRALGRRGKDRPDHLLFSSPELMVAFTRHAVKIQELAGLYPVLKGRRMIKNHEATLHHPAPVVKPTEIRHVQTCVGWALENHVGLTVVGGGHSGQSCWPNVLSVDMSAFDEIHIFSDECMEDVGFPPLVVAEAGCISGNIIRDTKEAGLTVPLGARPSVGAGLWLQGGIGHQSRLHGLACDAIVGAVIVSVKDPSQILCVGNVPAEAQPVDAVRPQNEAEVLWAIKGAGTNFGIVISVVFQAYAVPTYRTRNWVVRLGNNSDAQQKIIDFDKIVTSYLPRNCSADAYLHWENGQLQLGVTLFESLKDEPTSSLKTAMAMMDSSWGPSDGPEVMDGVGLFDAEMYVSRLHGGHAGGRTSSFKRCVFLKHIGEAEVARRLVAAIDSRPSPFCYLHLLQGGGAVRDVAAHVTAFGCRDWDFACVITGVWPRDQDDTEFARCVSQWVYGIAEDLLTLSHCCGAYGADLGPGSRDSVLATQAFGPNRQRLARLKHIMDPRDVLAYACPLPKVSLEQKIIVLVTGESCAGKDFCADVWASVMTRCNTTRHAQLNARVVSISSATKREYAAATGADIGRLLWDRDYKEEHRPALTAFFKEQTRERPELPKEQFLSVVRGAADVDVLLITGMRDEAPLAAYSHLVPESRLLEVYVHAGEEKRRRRGGRGNAVEGSNKTSHNNGSEPDTIALSYSPSLIFHNDMGGSESAEKFAKQRLLPFLHNDLWHLASMVSTAPEFPRPGIDFHHVLGIPQQPGGLALCASLLRTHFAGDWAKVDSVACCEAGGFIFAPVLALQVNLPLLLIRDAGKLPPPTVSVAKHRSYVSSVVSDDALQGRIELELDRVPKGAGGTVVVVDDVLSTGETLCAVLLLLGKAGVRAENVSVMIVAEFPLHRGRELLRQRGFGRTSVQSLLVFDGA